ncbi:MAG: LamG-like jellyroll fold domain-containing protein [Caldilineaceae bacterium]
MSRKTLLVARLAVVLLFALCLLAVQRNLPALAQETDRADAAGLALRLFGTGSGGVDRVRFALDAPARPIDVGAGSFTIEFWLKALAAENSGTGQCATNDGWITANTILDRDVYFAGDYGDFGIGLSGGRVIFGLSVGSSGTTVCSSRSVADGAWHHIAVTRDVASGALRIFIDGQPDGSATGPTGNASYRDGRSSAYANDPFLVLGAEKHDAGTEYPSFSGWIDELRISTNLRYTSAGLAPSGPFDTDAETVGLYHFDEGPAGPCIAVVLDASGQAGGPSNGACIHGGSPQSGPLYVADTPFAQQATATPSPTATPTTEGQTATPTPTPSATSTPTPSATPTVAPTPANDLIFTDSFEGGSLAQWAAATTDGGDLAVSADAALSGALGLKAVIDDNRALLVEDSSPSAEARYHARFYFDPNSIRMANGNAHFLLAALNGAGQAVIRLELRHSSTSYQVRLQARTERGSYVSTTYVALSDAPHILELQWTAAAPGTRLGTLELWVDTLPSGRLANIDNANQRIEKVQLGAVSGMDTATRGTYFLDAFEARRFRYIGPVSPDGPPLGPPAGSGAPGQGGGRELPDPVVQSQEGTLHAARPLVLRLSFAGASSAITVPATSELAGKRLRFSTVHDYALPTQMVAMAGPYEVELLDEAQAVAAAAGLALTIRVDFKPSAAGVPVVLLAFDPQSLEWVELTQAPGNQGAVTVGANAPTIFAAALDAALLPVQHHLPLVRYG